MRKRFWEINLIDIISGIFIILFTYTAIDKLKDYATFGIALRQSPVLQPYAEFLLIAIPVIELLAVVLLAFSITRRAGLYVSLTLMCMFTLYIFYLMLFAKELPCNCGGILRMLSWKAHLIINIFLTALASWTLLSPKFIKILLQ